MWALRILTGDQAGKSFALQPGSTVIGRSPDCDITIVSPGVSKEHARIDISESEMILHDLGSRNGTFVNGMQVKQHALQPTDKIALHDVIFDFVPAQMANPQNAIYQQQAAVHMDPQSHSYAQPAYQQDSDPEERSPVPQGLEGILHILKNYSEDVILPGVYKLVEWMEFRFVLMIFMAAFIVFVTSLSSIPLVRILKASIEKESQNRALTIAKTIAEVNRKSIQEGVESAISVEIGQREPGVDEALIINNVDGNIIAPASKAGRYPDLPFIHSARKQDFPAVAQIDDSTIGASVPIQYYNSRTGSQTTAAHAVVIYNMGSLAVDDSRTLSLFIQTFFIALVVGTILFYFLYKLVEYPFQSMNRQIDKALKEGHDQLALDFQMDSLQRLVSNVRSALSRAASSSGGSSDGPLTMDYDRSMELSNMVGLIGFPALGITAGDQRIAAINPAFEEKTSMNSMDLLHQNLEAIPDQALKLSVQDLLERVGLQPDQLATNTLEITGIAHELMAQAVYGNDRVAYVLIVILPMEDRGYEG